MDTLITVVLVLLAILLAIPVGTFLVCVLAWLVGMALIPINNVRFWYTRKRRARR